MAKSEQQIIFSGMAKCATKIPACAGMTEIEGLLSLKAA